MEIGGFEGTGKGYREAGYAGPRKEGGGDMDGIQEGEIGRPQGRGGWGDWERQKGSRDSGQG